MLLQKRGLGEGKIGEVRVKGGWDRDFKYTHCEKKTSEKVRKRPKEKIQTPLAAILNPS